MRAQVQVVTEPRSEEVPGTSSLGVMERLVFTYCLGDGYPFQAVTFTERPREATDVLTLYFDDPYLLASPACGAALGWTPETEIGGCSPEHIDDLHWPDQPLAPHAHVKKARSEMLVATAALWSRHMSPETVGLHLGRVSATMRRLRATPEVAGLVFEADDESYVVNFACVDRHASPQIDRSGFARISMA